jgi:hypothetical protein
MESRVYKIKKSYQFKNSGQANAFLEIANVYGKGRVFGSVAIYEASLEFIMWRKLQNLATIVSEYTINDIDIYKITTEAGFKAFKKTGL